jgi:hypothetical protein
VPADAPAGLPAVVCVPWNSGDAGAPPEATLHVTLRTDTGLEVNAQAAPVAGAAGGARHPVVLWFPLVVDDAMRGETLTFKPGPSGTKPTAPVTIRTIPEQAYEFRCRDRVVLRYNHGPKDIHGKTGPKVVLGYIHPVHGLDGQILTQDAPPDHRHHRGIFWAWPRLHRNGTFIGDWWTLHGIRYRPGKLLDKAEGPVFSTLTADGYWDLEPPQEGQPTRVVREVVTIRVFPPRGDYQFFDVDLELYGLVDGLTMAGQSAKNKGYGGFTMRLPRAGKTRIVADGKYLPAEAGHTMYRAYWADYSDGFGKPDADPETTPINGAAIFTDPTHPGDPPGWCLRPYGVLNPSWPGLDFVALRRDKPLTLRYRVVIHRGSAEQARLGELYKLYRTDWAARPQR